MRVRTDGGRGVLNVCAPYTSRDEITTSVRDSIREVCEKRRDVECVADSSTPRSAD